MRDLERKERIIFRKGKKRNEYSLSFDKRSGRDVSKVNLLCVTSSLKLMTSLHEFVIIPNLKCTPFQEAV